MFFTATVWFLTDTIAFYYLESMKVIFISSDILKNGEKNSIDYWLI